MAKVVRKTLSGDSEVWPVVMAALGAVGEMALEHGDVADAMGWVMMVEHVSRFATNASTKNMQDWAAKFVGLLNEAGHEAQWTEEEVEE